MKKNTQLVFALFIVFLLFFLLYRFFLPSHHEPDRHVFFAMDTFFEIQSEEKVNWDPLLTKVQTELNHVETQLNSYKQDSEIQRINKEATALPVKVSKETFETIQKAIDFGALSNGLFDITFQPLQDLYGFEQGKYRLPTDQEIEQTKEMIGFSGILLDHETQEIFLSKPGMKLNLSGLIKGIALDRVVQLLQAEGLHYFSLNFGGNLYILSEKDETIGIKSPTNSVIIDSVPIKKGFVSTSSNGEQYFIQNNQRYSHIINPITGSAVSIHDSVTVVSDSGILSDFLSTYLYMLPTDQIRSFMQANYPEAGYTVIKNDSIVLKKESLP